jgi:hypothetical protein
MEPVSVQEITWIKQLVPWSYNQFRNITYILNEKKIISANVYCNHRHLQENPRFGTRNRPRNNVKNAISVMVLQSIIQYYIAFLLVAKSSTLQTLCILLYHAVNLHNIVEWCFIYIISILPVKVLYIQ